MSKRTYDSSVSQPETGSVDPGHVVATPDARNR